MHCSHDAVRGHGLDEDGDGRGYRSEGMQRFNTASHETMLALYVWMHQIVMKGRT